MTKRRDDRAEPDDDVGISRIDVVNVERGVERSPDAERRDLSEALDRSALAIEHAIHLEARLVGVEAEAASLRTLHEASLADLQTVRADRDDFERAAFAARAQAKEDVARAQAETEQAKAAVERARNATDSAEQDAVLVGEQATRIREQAAELRVEADAARAAAGAAREEADKARAELETTRAELETTRAELETTRAELESALTEVTNSVERATVTAASHAALEHSLHRLREEIAGAFARVEDGAAEPMKAFSVVPPPGSTPPAPPPGNAHVASTSRDDLFVRLVDPTRAAEAATELRQHPEWLRGVPPPTLIAALSNVDYDAEGAVFSLAHAWDREPLCQALIALLGSEPEPRLREHSAWLLKHFAAPSSWRAIADLAKSEAEPAKLRRWLLEALDRLAAGRAIGWRELGDVVTTVARSADPSLRDGVVGILVALERSEQKSRLLLDILRSDEDEGVLASAVSALPSILPLDLDQALIDRLENHPNPRIQQTMRTLLERANQTKP